MSFLFTVPSFWPGLHLADSLWPVAPWQWLGAHQGPIEPLQADDGWEPSRLHRTTSQMESDPAIVVPSEGIKQPIAHHGRALPIAGSNKAGQSKSGLSSTPVLPHWHPTLLHSGVPTLASYEAPTERAHIHSTPNTSIIPNIGQQPGTLLDLPQMLSSSLETKVLSDLGVPTYLYTPSLQDGHLSEHTDASLQVGMDTWSSSIAQAPATMKPIEWRQAPKSNLPELQRAQTNSSIHTRQLLQDGFERNTHLWNHPPAYPDAPAARDNGPMQVHFHQPLIGHMQVQGTTPQDVRLFREQVEEALVDIFNNLKTMYPS